LTPFGDIWDEAMARKRKPKAAPAKPREELKNVHGWAERVRQWPPVYLALASLVAGVIGTSLGASIAFQAYTLNRQTAAVNRKLEVDKAIFEAWDLLGGRPGSLDISDHQRDKGTLELARRQIERALILDPENVSALLAKAAYLSASGAPDKSLEVLEVVAVLVPQGPVVHQYRGLALNKQGRHMEAAVHFRQALELDPSSAVNHFNLGTTLYRAGKYSEASATLKRAIELDPAMLSAYTNLAAVFRTRGHFKKAIEVARTAVSLASSDVLSLNDLASVFIDCGAQNEALQVLERAMAIDPNFALSYFNRGIALWKLGKLESAVADLRQSIKKDPRLMRAYVNLVTLLREQGKEVEAQEVLAITPRSITILGREGQLDEEKAAEHRASSGHLGSRPGARGGPQRYAQ
jgi:tetratricopeptide (TPR) repeat protein